MTQYDIQWYKIKINKQKDTDKNHEMVRSFEKDYEIDAEKNGRLINDFLTCCKFLTFLIEKSEVNQLKIMHIRSKCFGQITAHKCLHRKNFVYEGSKENRPVLSGWLLM